LLQRHLIYRTLLLILLGFAVRILLISYYGGLDGDQGYSLHLTSVPTPELIEKLLNNTLDVHPPLYFVLLKFWVAVAGKSIVSIRIFSIFCNMLLVAVAMRLTGFYFNRRAGLYLGVLWLLNPLLIWISLDVRMYALLGLCVLSAWLCLTYALYRRQWYWWIGFTIFALAALYTMLLGVVVLAAAGMLSVLHRRWQGILTVAIAGIGSLPYLYPTITAPDTRTPRNLNAPDNLFDYLLQQISGVLTNEAPFRQMTLLLVTIISLALTALAIWQRPRSMGIITLLIAGHAVLFYLAFTEDIYKAKYTAFLVAPTLIGVAGGLSYIPARYVRIFGLAAGIVLSIYGLTYDLKAGRRDDWLAVTHYIEQHADEGDLILIADAWGIYPFDYHYQGDLIVAAPFGLNGETPDFDAIMRHTTQNFDTVWFVQYQIEFVDPKRLIEKWFVDNYPVRTEIFPSAVTLKAYTLKPKYTSLPASATPLNITFGDQVVLRGYRTYQEEASARDEHLHPPSGWIPVTLYWEVLQPGLNFTPMVRLVDSIGQVYGGTLDRPNELTDRFPVSTWQPGTIWQADYDININPSLPEGMYRIEIKVWDQNGAPMPSVGEGAGVQWVILQELKVEQPDPVEMIMKWNRK